jgi:DNA-binding response OmpR family regulator
MSDKRLLIVDDQPALGEIVRRTAAGLGYDVKVTTHAEEFMAVFDDFNPTAIVLDIVMPDIDGIELVAWLLDRGCDARILVASGYNKRYAKMAETLGVAKGLEIGFLEKPYRIAELREALEGEKAC